MISSLEGNKVCARCTGKQDKIGLDLLKGVKLFRFLIRE